MSTNPSVSKSRTGPRPQSAPTPTELLASIKNACWTVAIVLIVLMALLIVNWLFTLLTVSSRAGRYL